MDNLVGLAILIGVAGSLSIVGALVFDRPSLIAGFASIAASVVMAVIGTVQSGYPDLFTPVAQFSIALCLVFGTLYALPVALAFSWSIHWLRRKRSSHHLQLTGNAREPGRQAGQTL